MARAKKEGQFLNAKISQELFDRVCDYSDQTRIPKTAIMEMALQDYMDKVAPIKSKKMKKS